MSAAPSGNGSFRTSRDIRVGMGGSGAGSDDKFRSSASAAIHGRDRAATDPGHSIISYAKGDALRIIFRKPSFGGVFVGERP
jgi:hypothetical protein